jgi:hypothetical protein
MHSTANSVNRTVVLMGALICVATTIVKVCCRQTWHGHGQPECLLIGWLLSRDHQKETINFTACFVICGNVF